MKKVLTLAIIIILATSLITGCGTQTSTSPTNDGEAKPVTIKVGATPEPHGEVLKIVKPILEKEGINLEIVEISDYSQINLRLADKELDANYFQHIPYLESFSKDHNLKLTYTAVVHIEPMGLYASKVEDLKDIPKGAEIAIPNDTTNGGRALLLLQSKGLLKLKDDVGIDATINDIVDNPKEFKITELAAATLPRVLQDVDAAVINANYALEADLSPIEDPLAIESVDDTPYVNVLAIREGDNRPELNKLADALNSQQVREFIEENYKGAVIPAF